MFVPVAGETPSFSNGTLVLSIPSLGGTGQLTIDALIATLNAKKMGFLDEEFVVPVAGNDAFTPSGTGIITTSLEVYQVLLNDKCVSFVQQRAPLIPGHNQDFVNRLGRWIKSSGFELVILVCSFNAAHRMDSQISGVQTRYLFEFEHSDSLYKEITDRLTQTSWTPLEIQSHSIALKKGTVATKLNKYCKKNKIPLLIFFPFEHRGSNIESCIILAKAIYRYIFSDVEVEGIITPTSWRHMLRPPPVGDGIFA